VTTSIKQYEDVMENWAPTGVVDHFPRLPPASSEDVAFSSFPTFMQGGGWVQLRVSVPELEILAIEAYCRARTTKRRAFTEEPPDPDCHVLAEAGYGFPEDFEVFLFDGEPYKEGSSLDWNHGWTYGMALSKKRRQMVYWAESW
jgi:hypothetical protein